MAQCEVISPSVQTAYPSFSPSSSSSVLTAPATDEEPTRRVSLQHKSDLKTSSMTPRRRQLPIPKTFAPTLNSLNVANGKGFGTSQTGDKRNDLESNKSDRTSLSEISFKIKMEKESKEKIAKQNSQDNTKRNGVVIAPSFPTESTPSRMSPQEGIVTTTPNSKVIKSAKLLSADAGLILNKTRLSIISLRRASSNNTGDDDVTAKASPRRSSEPRVIKQPPSNGPALKMIIEKSAVVSSKTIPSKTSLVTSAITSSNSGVVTSQSSTPRRSSPRLDESLTSKNRTSGGLRGRTIFQVSNKTEKSCDSSAGAEIRPVMARTNSVPAPTLSNDNVNVSPRRPLPQQHVTTKSSGNSQSVNSQSVNSQRLSNGLAMFRVNSLMSKSMTASVPSRKSSSSVSVEKQTESKNISSVRRLHSVQENISTNSSSVDRLAPSLANCLVNGTSAGSLNKSVTDVTSWKSLAEKHLSDTTLSKSVLEQRPERTKSPDSESMSSSVSLSSRSSLKATNGGQIVTSLKDQWAHKRLNIQDKPSQIKPMRSGTHALKYSSPTVVLRAHINTKDTATKSPAPPPTPLDTVDARPLTPIKVCDTLRDIKQYNLSDSYDSDVTAGLVFSAQPDVVANSIQSRKFNTVSTDLQLLHCIQQQCSQTKEELKRTRKERKYYSTALEAMIVVVKHLNHQLERDAGLRITSAELATIVGKSEVLLQQRNALIDEIQSLQVSNELQINGMIMTHQMELQSLQHKMQSTIKDAEDKHYQEITDLVLKNKELMDSISLEETKCAKLLADKEEVFERQHAETESRHKSHLNDLKKQQDTRVKELSTQFEQFRSELMEKYAHHQKECSSCAGITSEASDAAAVAAQQATQSELLEQEAASLKVVLDLRNDEINKLKAQNVELEKQFEELAEAKSTIRKLQQKLENAEAIVDIKSDFDRQLAEKHNNLLRKLDKESKVNKKLSLENEELEWKLTNAIVPPSPNMMRRSINDPSCFERSPCLTSTDTKRSSWGCYPPTASAPGTPRLDKRRALSTSSSTQQRPFSSKPQTDLSPDHGDYVEL